MKKYFIIILISINFLFSQQIADEIAAVIDNEIILKSDIEQALISYMYQNKIDIRKNSNFITEHRDDFLQRMIDQKVLLVKAKNDTLEVKEERVQDAADHQYQSILSQVGSEKKLIQMYNMPISRIKRYIEKNIREQMLVEMVQSEQLGSVKVSRRDVVEFYNANVDSFPMVPETIKIAHIVRSVKPSASALEKAKAKIDSIYQLLLGGEDFSRLAQQYSQDPGSGPNGGDLGFTEKGQFVKPFEDAAYSLNTGEISKPVLSDFGYHIIQLLEKRGEKIHTRHILIQVQPTKDDQERTRQFLLDFKKRILSGELTFLDAALQYSDDPNVKSDNGVLGVFEKDRISIPEFKAVAEILSQGEISDPFKTRFGFHILKMLEDNPPRIVNLDDDYERIHKYVLDRKKNEKMQELIKNLREEVPIKILLN